MQLENALISMTRKPITKAIQRYSPPEHLISNRKAIRNQRREHLGEILLDGDAISATRIYKSSGTVSRAVRQ